MLSDHFTDNSGPKVRATKQIRPKASAKRADRIGTALALSGRVTVCDGSFQTSCIQQVAETATAPQRTHYYPTLAGRVPYIKVSAGLATVDLDGLSRYREMLDVPWLR